MKSSFTQPQTSFFFFLVWLALKIFCFVYFLRKYVMQLRLASNIAKEDLELVILLSLPPEFLDVGTDHHTQYYALLQIQPSTCILLTELQTSLHGWGCVCVCPVHSLALTICAAQDVLPPRSSCLLMLQDCNFSVEKNYNSQI